MDLDAVLRIRPEVALVDELAHTNVPGSGRHDKRWQDVLDILGGGINIIIVAAVTPGPGTDVLLRRAARIAFQGPGGTRRSPCHRRRHQAASGQERV